MLFFGDSSSNSKIYRDFIKKLKGCSGKDFFESFNTKINDFFNYCHIFDTKEQITVDFIRENKEIFVKDSDFLYIMFKYAIENNSNSQIIEELFLLSNHINCKITKLSMVKLILNRKKFTCEEIGGFLNDANDFTFYKYALENNIDLSNIKSIEIKESYNYNIYLFLKTETFTPELLLNSIKLLHSLTSFNALKYILTELFKNKSARKCFKDLEKHTDSNNVIFMYLFNFFNYNELSAIDIKNTLGLFDITGNIFYLEAYCFFILYKTKQTNILCIDTHKQIVLIMNLTKKYKEKSRRIHILYVFTLRYFCMYHEIDKELKQLSIKNIQIYNTAYIWQDIQFVLKNYGIDKHPLYNLQCYFENDISHLERSIFDFVNSNMFGCAISSYFMYKKLKLNHFLKEYKEKKLINSKNVKTNFCELFGDNAEWIFEKSNFKQQSNMENKTIKIITIFNLVEIEKEEDLFENNYLKICDLEFKCFLLENIVKA